MKSFKEIQNAPMRNLINVELGFCLSRYIVDKPGLVGASITGKQQSGKSVYALQVLSELYQFDEEKIFQHIVFSIKDLTTLLRNAIKRRERLLCVLWDDASVHGAASRYNSDRALVQYLSALGDTLGIAVKGILMTSPSGDLIKAFRQYNFYKVQIGFGQHKYDRIARGYLKGTSPYGQPYYSRIYEDFYDVRSPIYQRYYEMRESLSLSVLDEMDAMLEKQTHSKKVYERKGKRYANIDTDE